MKTSQRLALIACLSASASICLAAAPTTAPSDAGAAKAGDAKTGAADVAVTKAVAVMKPATAAATQPANQNVSGTIAFTQTKDGVSFVVDIDGFEPNSRHAFHIHDNPDLTKADLTSAGKQWKPTDSAPKRPPGPDGRSHSMSDLGVLTADEKGHAHLESTIPGATLTGGDNPIVGHAVIIHANPPGKAGPRICGGAIEAAK